MLVTLLRVKRLIEGLIPQALSRRHDFKLLSIVGLQLSVLA